MSTDSHTLRGGEITATIKADGAELCSLKSGEGLELLWQAGSQWPRHAPLLFPIVGRLKNDTLRHDGKTYPMTQHGFARDLRFDWIEQGADSCKLMLANSAATSSHYPFAFQVTVAYQASDSDLDVTLEIANTGTETLPASIGAHPAFNWPLLPGLAKESYRLLFSEDETAPIRRLNNGLMRAAPEPSPVTGKTMALSDRLFDDDAVILDRPASRRVRYAADRGPYIELSWEGFRELGVWSKPGAPFLCIEPWHGFASPVDFDGEFSEKPGIMRIAPGERRAMKYRIYVGQVA
jgi:galactose mutarotase-like enzyme